MEIKIIQPCVNQETGKRHKPDDVISVGEFESARLISGGLAVPVPSGNLRNAMVIPLEKRGKRHAV